jgi:hypothetical protein
MSTQKSLTALEKTRDAVVEIKKRLRPVLERLKEDNTFDSTESSTTAATSSGEVQATIALSVGMMRYIGARLRGLDHGRKQDDSLRIDLNKMKKILAEIKKHKPKMTPLQQEHSEIATKSSQIETTRENGNTPVGQKEVELLTGQKDTTNKATKGTLALKEETGMKDVIPSQSGPCKVPTSDEDGQSKKKRGVGELKDAINTEQTLESKSHSRTKKARK